MRGFHRWRNPRTVNPWRSASLKPSFKDAIGSTAIPRCRFFSYGLGFRASGFTALKKTGCQEESRTLPSRFGKWLMGIAFQCPWVSQVWGRDSRLQCEWNPTRTRMQAAHSSFRKTLSFVLCREPCYCIGTHIVEARKLEHHPPHSLKVNFMGS